MVRITSKSVRSVARIVGGCTQDIEDIIQSSQLALLEKASVLKGKHPAVQQSYFNRILINKAMDLADMSYHKSARFGYCVDYEEYYKWYGGIEPSQNEHVFLNDIMRFAETLSESRRAAFLDYLGIFDINKTSAKVNPNTRKKLWYLALEDWKRSRYGADNKNIDLK